MFGIRALAGLALVGSLCMTAPASAQPWAGPQGYGQPNGPNYGPAYGQPNVQGYARGYDQYRPSLPPMAEGMGYADPRAYEGDRRLAHQAQAQALSYPQIRFVVRWSNPMSGNSGETFVAGEGRDGAGRPCRDLRETVRINGRQSVNTGLACLIDGTWRTVG